MTALDVLEREYWDLATRLDFLQAIEPANAADEQQRFFAARAAGNAYNPRFTYPASADDRGALRLRAEQLAPVVARLGEHPLRPTYDRLLADAREALAILALDRDDPNARHRLTALWSAPADDEVAAAIAALEEPQPASPPAGDERTSEEAARALAEAVRGIGSGWSVQLEPAMSARVSVNSLKRRVRVRADARFTDADIARLIVHEVGVHVARAENGRRQPFRVFAHGFPDYLATEEGLATVAEVRAGVLDHATWRRYAARLVAARRAVEDSFDDVFTFLLRWIDEDEAYAVTQRVKRGLADTSYPGGYTKDQLYFRGYRAVTRFLATGGDVTQLFIGKVGLEDTSLVATLLTEHVVLPPLHVPAGLLSAGGAAND